MAHLQPAAEAPAPTQTALVVAVPEAEPVVSEHRRHLDTSASWGVPAHVTVLYPFVAPGAVTERLITDLSAAVATVGPFDVAFAATGWFDQDVLWLAPEPAEPFRDLTTAVWAAFPDHPPYAGAHDGSTPHLTVAERSHADLATLRAVERAVQGCLPVSARIEEVLLIAGTAAPASWAVLRTLPLRAGPEDGN